MILPVNSAVCLCRTSASQHQPSQVAGPRLGISSVHPARAANAGLVPAPRKLYAGSSPQVRGTIPRTDLRKALARSVHPRALNKARQAGLTVTVEGTNLNQRHNGKPHVTALVRTENGGDTLWANVVVFGKAPQAELIWLKTGEAVSVQGEMRVSIFEKNGEHRASQDIVASNVCPLSQPTREKPKAGAIANGRSLENPSAGSAARRREVCRNSPYPGLEAMFHFVYRKSIWWVGMRGRFHDQGGLSPNFGKFCASEGRPSIPPEQLLKALLLQVFYSVRSERLLMEQLDYILLYR